jgi:hypothetical protein
MNYIYLRTPTLFYLTLYFGQVIQCKITGKLLRKKVE